MSIDFIKELQRKRSDYNYASQVKTQAKSLKQLSTGIYTEPERFVYELLQNAVDAFVDTGNRDLNILIKADSDKLLFMHNGKPFSEEDVIGICDVGNGTKAKDNNKIGYKGIGFKSVFMPSVNRVGIVSGEFSFEFDKDKAFGIMPRFKDEPLTKEEVPWQIIPIDSPQLKEEFEVAGFNVITIVYTVEVRKISSKIEKLFSDLQFLLFLRSDNVNISFEDNGKKIFTAEKNSHLDADSGMRTVTLSKNGEAQSTWIINSPFDEKDLSVPQSVKSAIEHDFNTPDKLKGASKFEISFAVKVEHDKVVKLKDTTIFTFLPTSYKNLNQPFLINSNFITDAGRQQLHQESEWNKLIFGKIPELYLKFVATFSSKYSNYSEVLPNKFPSSDTLTSVYRDALSSAFNSVRFIPNIYGQLLRLIDVLIDATDVAKTDIIPLSSFFAHVDSVWDGHFSSDNIVDDKGIAEYAPNIVHVFGNVELIGLISRKDVIPNMSPENNAKLVLFLHNYMQSLSELSLQDNNEFKESLKHCSFLLDGKKTPKIPQDLFFPSDFNDKYIGAQDVDYLNNVVYDEIKDDDKIIDWLHLLGVQSSSQTTLVEYILSHPDYVTTDNAISVGRFLFSAWKKENFLDRNDCKEKIKDVPFLSKFGTLSPATNLYLGSKYHPEDDMETVLQDKTLYVSDDYPENKSSIEDWSFFFKKCGVGSKVGVSERVYSEYELNYPFIKQVSESFSKVKHRYQGYRGYRNPVINIKYRINYFNFIRAEHPNEKTDKYVLSKVLSQGRNKFFCQSDKIFGIISYWGECRGVPPIEQYLEWFLPYSFTTKYNSLLEYKLAQEQKFPTTQGTFRVANEVFLNTPTNIALGGKYLPILDINSNVDESWLNIIPFQAHISLKDLLLILGNIAEDEESKADEKKEYINRVYKELLDRNLHADETIAQWASAHRMLSQSGEFLPAKELTYITVDGFKEDGSKIYLGKIERNDNLLQLLRSFGVKVITQKDITPKITGEQEDNSIKAKLEYKLQYIAAVKNGSSANYEKVRTELEEKLSTIIFYKCDSIKLSYGENDDTIAKTSYSIKNNDKNSFYYTGDISTPGRIEPLLTPLCRLCGIEKEESGLMVIWLTAGHDDLVEYLKEKGYNVDSLVNREQAMPIVNQGADEHLPEVLDRGSIAKIEQPEINKETRIRVKGRLEKEGYDVSLWNPEVSCPDIEGLVKTPEGTPINVIVRSAKGGKIYLSASSFELLMSNKDNILAVENSIGIHALRFVEIFGNNSDVNLIFDAKYTPREYFMALGTLFKYVKSTQFVVQDPNDSVYDRIQGFGFEQKNDGTVLISGLEDI